MNIAPSLRDCSTDQAWLRLRNVTRSFGPTVTALHGVSLEVQRGERLVILGKSGSGKSTLLNLLAGLDRPTSGSIEIDGRDLATMNSRELAEHRLRRVGMIFQAFHLIPTRTALQNVELPLVFAEVPARQRRERASQALAAVGLGERLGHYPAQLSGGEAQRVAIARALINEPALVLADEPTGNLDSTTARRVIDLLLEQISRLRATFILVTHDEELARSTARRTLRLQDGAIAESLLR